MPRRLAPSELRSQRWFGRDDFRSAGHRSRARQMGYAPADYEGKPIIGILNSWSDLSQCHTHFRQRAEDVKRGVWQAGGFPVEIPVLPITETFMKPSPMLYRNLLAMEVEELLRCQPIDGAVLMGGCDKTGPGPADGRDQRQSAEHLPAGGADAARQLEREGAGERQRHDQVLGGALRRARSATRTGRRSKTASRVRRACA